MSTEDNSPILGSEQADNLVYHQSSVQPDFEPDVEMVATDSIVGAENAKKVLTQTVEIATKEITSDQ